MSVFVGGEILFVFLNELVINLIKVIHKDAEKDGQTNLKELHQIGFYRYQNIFTIFFLFFGRKFFPNILTLLVNNYTMKAVAVKWNNWVQIQLDQTVRFT